MKNLPNFRSQIMRENKYNNQSKTSIEGLKLSNRDEINKLEANLNYQGTKFCARGQRRTSNRDNLSMSVVNCDEAVYNGTIFDALLLLKVGLWFCFTSLYKI